MSRWEGRGEAPGGDVSPLAQFLSRPLRRQHHGRRYGVCHPPQPLQLFALKQRHNVAQLRHAVVCQHHLLQVGQIFVQPVADPPGGGAEVVKWMATQGR
jgi:hypothetical protein